MKHHPAAHFPYVEAMILATAFGSMEASICLGRVINALVRSCLAVDCLFSLESDTL
jgi:hypothetical protein